MSTDAKHSSFFAALGEAIASWAYVEGQLFEIVGARLGAPPPQAAVVFGRTPQMAAHVALAGELLGVTLPPDDVALRKWKAIEKRFEKLLPIRNMLVHQPVHYGGSRVFDFVPDGRGGGSLRSVSETPADFSFGLSPVAQARQRPKLPSALSGEEIRLHLKAVRQLLIDLEAFQKGLPPL